MVKQTIQIFCRLKPTKAKKCIFELENKESGDQITLSVPKDAAEGYINNKKEEYRFRFERIFNMEASQDDIFQAVAEPVIDNVLSGYNGTIFAYGQTGSGKTFTITGGPENYNDRGIIPRSISYFFELFSRKPDNIFTMHISYLELYNESGYDLLDPQHQASKLEDLPKVTLMEDEDNCIHLKNLSIHLANNEEEALNLLFLGDTNRMIAETPMNQASTRSHCIFTIHITARETGSATIRKAKLHLVDLAGSERVGKTNVNGILLTEAKYINLSLHYLEQVIVALAEKNRSHVPYRNSMMTSVLRDSLGGNCMTTMIATCSLEKKNLDESISTCRFAQRVALIKNEALVNEELDPKLIINRLKREVEELKNQLAISQTEYNAAELTNYETEKLRVLVQRFLEDKDAESANLNVGADMRKINYCFKLLKEMYIQLTKQGPTKPGQLAITSNNSNSSTTQQSQQQPNITIVDSSLYDTIEMKDLKDTLRQRDNEISILVNMLKKEKKKISDQSNGVIKPASNDDTLTDTGSSFKPKNRQILKDMSMGKQEAFEIFKRDYQGNVEIEEQKRFLKNSYAEAKLLGELINTTRNKLNNLKSKSEQIYLKLEATNSLNDVKQTAEYDSIHKTMEYEKENYRLNFEKLKNLKSQIEHAQYLVEKASVRLQKDFDLWWTEQCELIEAKNNKNSEQLSHVVTSTSRGLGKLSIDSASSVASSIQSINSSLFQSQVGSRPNSSLNSTAMSQSYYNQESKPVLNETNINNKPRVFAYLDSDKANSSNLSSIANDSAKINLTGDNQIDADITAFINARKRIINQMKPS